MPSLRSLWPVVLLCVAAPRAQETRADDLSQRRSAAPSGSLAWFRLTAELVDAQLVVDGAAAFAIAREAWQRAADASLEGAAETMAAMAELAVSRTEGPDAARTWGAHAVALPPGTAPELAAHYHLARARSFCHAGDHASELAHSIPGQEIAARTGDVLLGLLAAQITLHVTPGRNVVELRERFERARLGPRGDEVAAFEPWILLDEAVRAAEVQPRDAVLGVLDRVEQLAQRQGNRLAFAHVLSLRGNLWAHTDPTRALASYERACEVLRQVGDRRELAATLDIRAWLHGRLGDFERSDALVAEATQLVAGRGLTGVEAALLQTRIDVATRRGDGVEAARLVAERDRRNGSTATGDEQVRAIRARLEASERETAQREAELRDAAAQAGERTARDRIVVGVVVIASLLGLIAVSWHSRRRLREANRRLAAEVELVEAARRDQAALEERLRSLERAQGLGTMAAGVAHDFNNLLTGILANAELIEEGGPHANPVTLAQGIRKAGRRAAHLCKQLQTYTGGAPIEPTEIDLAAAMRSLLPVLRSACGDHVELELCVENEGLFLRADPTALDQAVLNLVINARDAKARHVVLTVAAQPAGHVRIEVRDDGEGMEPDVAGRVFDPFFTTRFPGRGLGLAVVSGIVRRHGGTISVASTPGEGSTFRIELPAVDHPSSEAEPIVELPRRPPAQPGTTALVVDDDENVRGVMLHMLRFLGCKAKGFADGEALLAAVAEVPAALDLVVFVDLTMPGVDGMEVLQRVRQVRPGARVVLMSGHTDAFVEQVAGDAAPDRVLPKPFQLEGLRELLDDLGRSSSGAEAPPR